MAEYPRGLDYTTLRGQQELLRRLSREAQALDAQRVYASYRQLATNVDFQIVLDSWITRLMLVELTNEQEMAKHNFVATILTELRNTQVQQV